MSDLLLVIDMQNVYRPGEEWGCPAFPRALRNITTLLDAGVPAVFTRFVPPVNPVGAWQDYNRDYAHINENPYLNDMAAELKPYLERFPLADKSTYSSWTAEVARLAEGYDRILLSGVVAECCVLATLMAAMDAGKKVVYLADCVAGQSDEYERSIQKIAEIYVPMHTLVMDANAYLSSQI